MGNLGGVGGSANQKIGFAEPKTTSGQQHMSSTQNDFRFSLKPKTRFGSEPLRRGLPHAKGHKYGALTDRANSKDDLLSTASDRSQNNIIRTHANSRRRIDFLRSTLSDFCRDVPHPKVGAPPRRPSHPNEGSSELSFLRMMILSRRVPFHRYRASLPHYYVSYIELFSSNV